MSALRYFLAAQLIRPTVGGTGDLIFEEENEGFATRVALWIRRPSAVVQGQGESHVTRGIGFLPPSPEPQRRDRLVIDQGYMAGNYEIVEIVPAHDDRGVIDHWGIEVRKVSG